MNNEEKNIAQVIPAVKLPRDLTQFFSYKVPEDLKNKIQVGNTVKISFRRKDILGVVESFSTEQETGFKLKEIEDIVENLSLTSEQLQLSQFISEYYFTQIGLVIKTILPEITKKDSRTEIKINESCEIEEIGKEIAEEVSSKIKESDKTLLIHNLDSQKHSLYKEILKQQDDNTQTLLMFPEYFDIWNFAQVYIDAFGRDKVAILCSDITKNQYFEEWQKVKSGQAKLVISTRQGVFAPFQNLKLIIVDDEHNSSYKQWDQNPRYSGVAAAIKLSEISKAKILLSSPTPTLETFYRTQEDFTMIDISQKLQTTPRIINLEDERKCGNYSFISEKLHDALIEKIYAKKQALIFIPRLGEKTFYQCKECGWIAECKVCQSPLIGYKDKLYCPRCKETVSLFKSCPKCQGQNIGAFGGGSKRVFGEIEKIFEGKNIKIVELDSSTSKDSKQNQKIFENFQKGKIDILVGTQMIWKNWNMQNLGLVGIIFPEIIFATPGFRSKEKAWQFLNKLYGYAQNKTVIIETFKPDHKYFEEMKTKTAPDFLSEELDSRRQSFSAIPYPPFGKLIKLIYKNPSPQECEKEAKWQYKLLQKEILDQNLQDSFEVMPPFPAQSYREYGKYRWHIILRQKNNGLHINERDRVLNCVKSDWIVDIDPEEIL